MSYANAWLKWFDVIEGGAAPLTERMLALSELESGDQVLDIGTGLGEPALSAATRLSKAGHVLAIDHDPNMIALAQQRAEARDASNIDFRVADVEALDLAPNSLDVVFARWSLMFVGDFAGVLSMLCEALRPGGKLVAATWASADLVPALSLARTTVQQHFKMPPSPQGQPKTFALSDADTTKRALIQAGYQNVSVEPFSVAYEFSSPASYIQYRLDVAGSLWDDVGIAAENAAREASAAIEMAMQPYRVADDLYRLVNEAHCAVGNV
jgi:ubiquinone/menaquinone biosynthesis C-methylase UbiE